MENYFKDIFKSFAEREWGEALHAMTTVISPEMNCSLAKEFFAEEVKDVTFQMGADKTPGPDGFYGIFFFRNFGASSMRL